MVSVMKRLESIILILSTLCTCLALLLPSDQSVGNSRRAFLATAGSASIAVGSPLTKSSSWAAELQFQTTPSGLQWADAKVGSGPIKSNGEMVAIDYTMQTTGARYGTKIYSTTDKNTPYRWKLGDETTIAGLEEAILGGEGIPAMQPGGIRRLIVPSKLGYLKLAEQPKDCTFGKGVGPIPPTNEAFEEYQRFKNIYCNPNRPYQPDLVLDIKLYGKRS